MENELTERTVKIGGVPTPRQREFFASRSRFTAYGGARGGGKSWALRRKLVAMCLRYEGIRCLLVRRTFPELRANHVVAFLREYEELAVGADESYIPADVRATSFWLKNRQPERWSDKPEGAVTDNEECGVVEIPGADMLGEESEDNT